MDSPEWQPKKPRPQSTIARNFMTELDDLFKLDGDLDSLDKNVHQKKQAVSTQTQELEALEARLRATEERLNQAKGNSPPRPKDKQRRSPIAGVFSEQDKARLNGPSESQPQKNPGTASSTAGVLPDTPSSISSADYVLVERPRSAQPVESEQA